MAVRRTAVTVYGCPAHKSLAYTMDIEDETEKKKVAEAQSL